MKLICDFCNSPEPRWSHKVPPGRLTAALNDGSGLWADSGEWLACDPCSDCILAKDEEGLYLRGLDSLHLGRPTTNEDRLKVLFIVQFVLKKSEGREPFAEEGTGK